MRLDNVVPRDSTPSPASLRQRLRIGEWLVDGARNEMRRGDQLVKLEPKATEVLIYLALKQGAVIPREELLAQVWPGVIVGDDALTQAVIKLRRSLGDDAHQAKYIETIAKRGYRLCAQVERIQPDSKRTRALPRIFAMAALFAAVAATLFFLAWKPSGVEPAAAGESQSAARSMPVIAVLPLANLSGDPGRDYFSDGITEDIIDALGRFPGLGVIARASVEPYRQRGANLKAVATELGARYLVTGSVREAEGNIRIAVELTDTASGRLLWSDRFEANPREVLAVPDRIVGPIVGNLEVKVTKLEQQRAASKAPGNLEAYDLVLRARSLLARTERSANREARGLLRQAQKLAPDLADAYTQMARAEINRVAFGWIEHPGDALRRAEEMARRALAIDDTRTHGRAYAVLATVANIQGRFDESVEFTDRAVELNPSDAEIQATRGTILLYVGRLEEALASLEMAYRFNPRMGASQGVMLALAYFLNGKPREGLRAVDDFLSRHPDIAFLHALRAGLLADLGDVDAARAVADKVRRDYPGFRAGQFGTRFRDPAHTARVQDSLGKAGF